MPWTAYLAAIISSVMIVIFVVLSNAPWLWENLSHMSLFWYSLLSGVGFCGAVFLILVAINDIVYRNVHKKQN